MLDANWPDSWRGAFRIELRAEAIGLAWRGWPVLPGVNPAPLTDSKLRSRCCNAVLLVCSAAAAMVPGIHSIPTS